jgi:hypothetical protein
MEHESVCNGEVVRYEPLTQLKGMYAVAVRLTNIDPETRKSLDLIIDFFDKLSKRSYPGNPHQ